MIGLKSGMDWQRLDSKDISDRSSSVQRVDDFQLGGRRLGSLRSDISEW